MQSFKRQIYKISHFEEPKNTPPEVDDSRKEFIPDEVNFEIPDFTNNFRDSDGDSYHSIRVRTLPTIGQLKYNNAPIAAGAIYNLDTIENLTYELTNNYMVTETGFCQFEKPILEIIQEKEMEGYELVHLSNGIIEFEKRDKSIIPDNTNIYSFIDITSMTILEVEELSKSLTQWHNDYKQSNDLYKGELYILPVNAENWLSFPEIIHRGSSDLVGNNIELPEDDYMQYAKLPPNFITNNNNENTQWEIPKQVAVLSFIEEVDSGDQISGTAYHRNRSDYGLSQQPSNQYINDTKTLLKYIMILNFSKE